ncbi:MULTISPECIES: hypothetical protein [Leptolyngbya]|uniref:hypothetical protein n=1 Tax=Leptolyngbya TaxID=47251 RepID=UPI001683AE64|nr:hypothetical protein [Leptolyngbya sp. FACHB-1624]MBD1859765.1 hypothetical protein [Leptolyngbya sp. FACHB-1624]
MKEIKSGSRPTGKVALRVGLAVIVLIGIVGAGLMKLFAIEISIAPAAPNAVPMIKTTESPSVEPVAPVKIEKPNATAIAAKQGNLRIRNRSDYPIRVALLSRQPKEANLKSGSPQSGFAPPAHWDFAPQEGSQSGLLVSLPQRSIQLKRGDVVVAFAQDGSQRYWGPFVVGETERPDWSAQAGEWELVIEN